MSGIAAGNVEDRLKIGFAIGAGCVLGAPKHEVIMHICELLLVNGYQRQYEFAKYLLDDLDISVESNLKHRYEEFINAIRIAGKRCHGVLLDLKLHFAGLSVKRDNLTPFINQCERKKNVGRQKIIDLFAAFNECLIHFEMLAQIPGMFSRACTKHILMMDDLTDIDFAVLIPVINLLIDGYQLIEYPLIIKYHKVTLELHIDMPDEYDTGTRKISYKSLIKCLENIEAYRLKYLRVILNNLIFDERHYECIVNLKNILRRFKIDALHVNFECQRIEFPMWQDAHAAGLLKGIDSCIGFAPPLRDDPLVRSEFFLKFLIINLDPCFRRLIISRILSMTNVKTVKLPYAKWWREQFDGAIRAVKLEENALYSPLLPMFNNMTWQRREHLKQVLDAQPQQRDVKKVLYEGF